MHSVSIHSVKGVIDHFAIDDDIEWSDGRVSRGSKSWYKGIGLPYSFHFVQNPTQDYKLLEKMSVFYLGWKVQRDQWIGKIGIFAEPYQPQFTDWIGGCGTKELSIIENSMVFEKSSVRIIKSHRLEVDKNQYWFELDYACGRRKYLENGFPKKLQELIEYMVRENWNLPWEKDSITDISYNGLVSDVADLFFSRELDHKLGTVYSILYSLGVNDPKAYERFLKSAGMKHQDLRSYVTNSIRLLKRAGIDVSPLEKPYDQILRENLVTGRNCGHCVLDGLGEEIKQEYLRNLQKVR